VGKADGKSKPALGFLTVTDHAQYGLVGGYLVLNMAGRPLEFHCTAPIRPNRAQQILYGPTLLPYLYGEQIGQTLLSKATTAPLVVCTDQEPALAVREFITIPVVLVLPGEAAGTADTQNEGSQATAPAGPTVWRVDAAHPDAARWTALRLGRNRLAVPPGEENRRLVAERLEAVADSLDLAEPFSRIREAIEEARRGGQ